MICVHAYHAIVNNVWKPICIDVIFMLYKSCDCLGKGDLLPWNSVI